MDFRARTGPKRILGPEFNPWYWNPNRAGVRTAPASFMERFTEEMGSELEVTWNPINERWQVWSRSNRVNHPVCSGWRLLFIHNGPSGEYLPLDERVYARLYSASARANGNGKQYFQRIVSEMERDQERAKKASLQDTIDIAMESFDHSRIKVGYGSNNGSKFSEYHA